MTYLETTTAFLEDLHRRGYSHQTTIPMYRSAVTKALPTWLAQQAEVSVDDIMESDMVSHAERLCEVYTSDTIIRSRQASRLIRLFIRDLCVRGNIPHNLNFEKPEPWKAATENAIMLGAGIMVTRETSLPDLIPAYLHYCQTDKDLSLFSIYRSREYLEKVTAFYEGAPVFSWNLRTLIDALYAKGMGTISVRHYTNYIKYFGDFLVEMELLASNPFVDVRLKPKQKPEKTPLCKKEQERLLHAPLFAVKRVQPELYQLRDTSILHLLLTTGIRLLEISELQVRHVNLEEKTIVIYGKGNKNVPSKKRLVYLENPDTLDILTRYMAHRSSASPYLFIKADGAKLPKGAYHYLMRTYGEQAGITQPVNSCLLRASFASSMIENGIDPITLKELMGHSSIKTTYRYYIFLREEHVKSVWKANNPLAALLGGE